MKHPVGKMVALFGALAFACASPPSAESEKLDPALAKLVLSEVPADVPNRTFVDFGGKLHLVGWELSPKDRAAPGSTLTLELYWRSVKKLPKGYHLFTHLTQPDGKVHEFDDVGLLRETVSDAPRLPPSAWVPGMIYVDQQNIVVPDVTSSTLVLSVGVESDMYAVGDAGALEKAGESKLEVLSGVSDGKQGALLARLATGVRRGDKGQKDKDGRRRPGSRPGMERRPGNWPGRAPAGDAPGGNVLGMEKEAQQ